MLSREGLIEPVQGRGIRLKHGATTPRPRGGSHPHSVGVLIPEALGRLRPSISLMIEELQAELYDMEVRLQVHASPACYAGNPARALEKLVEKNPHDCWILVLSQRPLQKWFMERSLPCVVSGSIYSDVVLPSVDFDYKAVCRHAAGRLLALGHRRIAFLNRRLLAAGDVDSEAGFHEAVAGPRHEKVDARIIYHDDDLPSVFAAVRQLIENKTKAPTGLIVANSFACLSTMTTLTRCGLRVPEDVSLIARDDDPFLAYVDPIPARYIYDVSSVAKKQMALVRALLDGSTVHRETVRIVPHFSAGGSLRKLA